MEEYLKGRLITALTDITDYKGKLNILGVKEKVCPCQVRKHMLVTTKNKVNHGVSKLTSCNSYVCTNIQQRPGFFFTSMSLCHFVQTQHICLDPEQPVPGHSSCDPVSTIHFLISVSCINLRLESVNILLRLYTNMAGPWILDTEPNQKKSFPVYFCWIFNYKRI